MGSTQSTWECFTERQSDNMVSLVALTLLLTFHLTLSDSYSCPEMNVDMNGNDIEAFKGIETWNECGEICEGSFNCRFWTWTDLHECWLKTSDEGLAHDVKGCISGAKGCK